MVAMTRQSIQHNGDIMDSMLFGLPDYTEFMYLYRNVKLRGYEEDALNIIYDILDTNGPFHRQINLSDFIYQNAMNKDAIDEVLFILYSFYFRNKSIDS